MASNGSRVVDEALCDNGNVTHGYVTLVLPPSIRAEIIDHARACLPLESCGLVAGRDGTIETFYPVDNEARSATAFRLDGRQQLQAEKQAEMAGLAIIGVVHSHPNTPAELSATDRADAEYYDPGGCYVHLVVSLRQSVPTIRAFRLREGTVLAVTTISGQATDRKA